MATAVIMPRQGQSVESCIITKWHKAKGDPVKAGDILFSYETDKAAFEEEAKVDGVLLDIFFEEDDDVPVLTNVCVIGEAGENIDEYRPGGANSPASESVVESIEKAASKQEETAAQAAPQVLKTGELKISPRARMAAARAGIDYRYANPSGPEGRIIERDITELQKSGPVFTASAMAENIAGGMNATVQGSGLGGRVRLVDLRQEPGEQPAEAPASAVKPSGTLEYEDRPIANIRKVIAKAMHNSLANTAQLTLNSSFDASEVLELRKKFKEYKNGMESITLNDMILYAVSRTLTMHKTLNAHMLDDKMRLFKNVQLGVAVDTERGLMVPTLFNSNLKSLKEISSEVKQMVEDCRKGSINPDMLKDGTFTVTNLGTLDIESFTPILNPPQTGILGVNNITYRVKEVNGEYVNYPAMGLSLTFDHRAVDGAPAARFLKDLKKNLENFSMLLAGA